MPNAIKGEVSFPAGEETYTFVFDFNAICELETELEGADFASADLQKPSVIRKVFCIGLQAYHPGMDEMAAGRIIHEIGPQKAAEVIAASFERAYGKEAAKAPAGPRKPAAKRAAGGSKTF